MPFLVSNSAGLGMAAGAAWGGGDFSGGLAARRAHVTGVVTLAYSMGLLLMLGALLVTRERIPSLASFAWAVAAGAVGGGALAAFYQALAQGKMGVVGPVSAVLTAAIPVAFGAFAQGWPSPSQLAGFLCAMTGIWLISRPAGSEKPAHGLGLALLSGVGFGFYLIFIHQASVSAVLWPLVASRAASIVTVGGAALALGRFRAPTRAALPLASAAGLLDVSGVACFELAAQTGRLDVASVLASLYPALTVLLARVFLKERLQRGQQWGMALSLLAIALIVA